MPKLLPDTAIHNNVDPSEANWYWEVIFEWPGEFGPQTDSSYGYTKHEVTPESRKRDFELAYPEATVLEVNVTMTPNNPDYKPPQLSPHITHNDEDPTITGKFF